MFSFPYTPMPIRPFAPLSQGMFKAALPVSRALDIPRASNYLNAALPLTKRFSWGGLFSGASKTISTINQALPLYNQVRPLIGNARTLLRMAKVMNRNGFGSKESEETTTEEPKEEEKTWPKEKDIIDVRTAEEKIETGPAKPFFS